MLDMPAELLARNFGAMYSFLDWLMGEDESSAEKTLEVTGHLSRFLTESK